MAEKINLVSAEDFLAKLRQGTKETYEIKARGLTITVRMISIDERLDIRNRCMAKNSKEMGDQTNLGVLVQKETLKAATTIAGESSLPERFFSLITLDETMFIYNEYLRICEEVNPSLETIDGEHFTALITALKKNSISASSLSLPQLKAVCLAYQDLIQRLDLPTSPTDNLHGGPS